MIYSHIYKNYDEANYYDRENHNNDKVRKALRYIYNNYNKDITLETIAKEMNLSEGEASRVFKKVIKESPIEYLIKYRCNMASYYLKNTSHSVTDIAMMVGFSSSNYFTIAYKKINGITPREYRKLDKLTQE